MHRAWIVVFFSAAAAGAVAGPPAPAALSVDWPAFLARNDLTWERAPVNWWEAPFLGNGELGLMVRVQDDHTLRVQAGSSAVHDHRADDLRGGRVPNTIEIHNRGRLPVGDFLLKTAGAIRREPWEARMDLWNAEARGTTVTGAGSVRWRAVVHAEDLVAVVEYEPSDGEAESHWTFVPEKAVNPRPQPKEIGEGWVFNPDPRIETDGADGFSVCVQDLVAGGQTATAWVEVAGPGRLRRLVFSVQHSYPGAEARARAVEAVRRAAAADFDGWLARHRAWWHAYYPQSFLSFPDAYWESYYWIQMYKLAAATRPGRALIDNQGPWLQPTGWGGTWWNLNVQLSYSPVPTANRLALGQALVAHLDRYRTNLVLSVDPAYRADSAGLSRNTGMDLLGWAGEPGGRAVMDRVDTGSEVGNLAWACHNVYRQYRYAMDEAMARDVLFPILRRAVNYYRHFLAPGEDGKLHLPPTHSPEYRTAPIPDCNYDLSLIRWGCATLLELADALRIDDPLKPEWQRILEELAPFPADDASYFIGAGVPYANSHRHWSHLLMIYPLRVVRPEEGHADWIRRCRDHWQSKPGALLGYSCTGAMSMSALLGDGEGFLKHLAGFRRFNNPNTLYREGGRLPVMETPLHCAAALQEAFLQSYAGRIFVFRAVPEAWRNAAFHRFLADGAFEVSAARRDGATAWVELAAKKGGRAAVYIPFAGTPAIACTGGGRAGPRDDGGWDVTLAAGERAVFTAAAGAALTVEPVARPDGEDHPFGLKAKARP